jgi:hypothetical protein
MNAGEQSQPAPKNLKEFAIERDGYKKLALSVLVIKEYMQHYPHLR